MSMKLRFRARGTSLVQNFERLEAGIKSFVGRRYQEVEPGLWGFVPTGDSEEVSFMHEYVSACKEECLWPADEATAAACGVKFDPNFGAPAKAEKPTAKTS